MKRYNIKESLKRDEKRLRNGPPNFSVREALRIVKPVAHNTIGPSHSDISNAESCIIFHERLMELYKWRGRRLKEITADIERLYGELTLARANRDPGAAGGVLTALDLATYQSELICEFSDKTLRRLDALGFLAKHYLKRAKSAASVPKGKQKIRVRFQAARLRIGETMKNRLQASGPACRSPDKRKSG